MTGFCIVALNILNAMVSNVAMILIKENTLFLSRFQYVTGR
jgi:hypothetical protein